ncbi:hypothetical protein [Salinisphaera orenii]|uniref:hypothetical protein n=1 Tax=Salinisphaera orenii TaxID=856731 RepID=UPI000DBE2310
MALPAFFDDAPTIRVRDPLADVLGTSDGGLFEYHYADAVRLAGHSCPTVAGTFLMARAALAALYPQESPERGGISVHLPAPIDRGTIGVIAQVLTLITGASGAGGFKGIGGRFARRWLLTFAEVDRTANDDAVVFTRVDTGHAIAASFRVAAVPAVDDAPASPATVAHRDATESERRAFGDAWQERVRRMLIEHADDPALVQVDGLDRASRLARAAPETISD